MLKSGTICFNDMYFFAEVTAKAAADAGMRAVASMILVDFLTRFTGTPEEYLRKGLALPTAAVTIFCPVARLLAAGMNVALGTDGTASNNDLDMMGELRTAALLGKGVADSPAALPAYTVLRMATLNGARALGIDAETGSLELGKSADMVALDLRDPDTQPVYNPVFQVVYAAGCDQVRQVWGAGRHLIRDDEPTTLDSAAILEEARE